MGAPYEIVSKTIDPVTVTEIRAPFDCSNVTIQQEDEANAATITAGSTATIQPGAEERITPSMGDSVARSYRWRANDLVCTAKSVAGTGPLKVKFCR